MNNCQNRIVHTVQEGDSLYRLAREYQTTVTELILGNPGVNPYNLQVGMRLYICPGEGYTGPWPEDVMPLRPGMMNPNMPGMMNPNMPGMMNPTRPQTNPNMPEMLNMGGNMPSDETESERDNAVENLLRSMRLAWLDLLYWTRMYLMTVSAGSNDQQDVEDRLMQSVDEITDVFAEFLPINVTRQLRNLLTNHVELTGEIIRALKANDMENYEALVQEWYGNANQIAELLGAQNPYFGNRETRNLLLNYLDMLREVIEQQIKGAYGQSIETFRDTKNHVLELADYFARGLFAR